MKITKITISVFFLAFLIGYISVPQTKQVSAPIAIVDIRTQYLPLAKNETTFEPEIFDIIDVWENEGKFKIKLVDVAEHNNTFRKDEVIAKSGESWLGLFKENEQYVLRHTTVKIKQERKLSYEKESYVRIKFGNKSEPVFLLKNAKKLKEGEVKTLYRHPLQEEREQFEIELPSLKQGFIRQFQLGDKKYTLRVKEGWTKSNEKSLALILETENTSQVIHVVYGEPGNVVGDLLWIGDLDRDGKLDLYMDFYNYEKGSFGSGLFLSSEAKKGQIVKQAAYFGTAGC